MQEDQRALAATTGSERTTVPADTSPPALRPPQPAAAAERVRLPGVGSVPGADAPGTQLCQASGGLTREGHNIRCPPPTVPCSPGQHTQGGACSRVALP